MLTQELYSPASGLVRASVSVVGHVSRPSVPVVSAPASAHACPSAVAAPVRRSAPVSGLAGGLAGSGWLRGTASAAEGIGGAERAVAPGKARTQQPNDLFDLMNRRDSRPWRPPH